MEWKKKQQSNETMILGSQIDVKPDDIEVFYRLSNINKTKRGTK